MTIPGSTSWWKTLCCCCCFPSEFTKDSSLNSVTIADSETLLHQNAIEMENIELRNEHKTYNYNVYIEQMKLIRNWKTRYWLDIDKIVDYHETDLNLKLKNGKNEKRRKIIQRTCCLMYKCMKRLPSNINLEIYSYLEDCPFVVQITKLYIKSPLVCDYQTTNANNNVSCLDSDLGLLMNSTNIIALWKWRQMNNISRNMFWKDIGLHSLSSIHSISLIIRNKSRFEIYVSWINYKGIEQSNSMIDPMTSTVIGTFVTHTFAIRVHNHTVSSHLEFNHLSLLACYQIRHTFPSHILVIQESLLKPIIVQKGSSDHHQQNIVNKQYSKCVIHGFQVLYEKEIFEKHPDLHGTLALDLQKMCEVMKNKSHIISILMKFPLILNSSLMIGHLDSMEIAHGIAFHHDIRWLSQNNISVFKMCHIEIYNCEDYLSWRKCQPFILCHEFVHAFHFWIGRERKDITQCYESAVIDKHLYQWVLHRLRPPPNEKLVHRRGYASMNKFEYFAQISEAYFGNCNYFPFNAVELKKYDAKGFELCHKIWELFDKQQIQHEHQTYFL